MTEQMKWPQMTDRGEPSYSYEIDGSTYIVVDMHNYQEEWQIIVDVGASRWFRLDWYNYAPDGKSRRPNCSCGELIWSREGRMTLEPVQACPHWQAWHQFYLTEMYDPPEV